VVHRGIRRGRRGHRLRLALRRCRSAGAAAGLQGAGGGPYSAVMSRMWPVLVSRVRSWRGRGVVTVCSTTKLVGEFSLMTVRVPSPWELKASMVAGLKVAPSQPLPMGRSVMMWPSVAERMTMSLFLRQAAKRMLFLTSRARPAQPPPWRRDVVFAGHLHGVGVDDGDGVLVFDVDVDLALAVELACSGAPPMSMVPRMEPSLSSMTVMLGAEWERS
jgi:hypothetical protein